VDGDEFAKDVGSGNAGSGNVVSVKAGLEMSVLANARSASDELANSPLAQSFSFVPHAKADHDLMAKASSAPSFPIAPLHRNLPQFVLPDNVLQMNVEQVALSCDASNFLLLNIARVFDCVDKRIEHVILCCANHEKNFVVNPEIVCSHENYARWLPQIKRWLVDYIIANSRHHEAQHDSHNSPRGVSSSNRLLQNLAISYLQIQRLYSGSMKKRMQ